jgi:predicted N-acetyltransferase YhbS
VANLPHRRTYADDPTLCDRIFDLLVTWIPELRPMRERAEKLRWRWEDVSTPFVHERDGKIVSHVGVLEEIWVCHGEERRVGGIHAVCTLESERRRGLYRQLMDEVLAHCEERYATLELSTENPEYYEPFGFRQVPEYRFVTRVESNGGRDGLRALDLLSPDDLDLLDALLESRAPVSQSLGVVREKDVFKFNQGSGRDLRYCEALDALVVMSVDEGRLELNDLVARELPDLATLLSFVREPVREVLFHFNPEHLDASAEAERTQDGDVLMVRGEFPFGGGDLPIGMLAPPAGN